MDLLDYYRDNLNYIRNLSAEFAAEFPKIARRLLISDLDCQDPYIERLLEGTAFLAARVEKKLDEGYYPFLESVLNSVAPDALYPVPSGAVLEAAANMDDGNVKKGAPLKAGTIFEAQVPGVNTPCRFACAEDLPLAAFTLTQAGYIHDLSSLGIKNSGAESALHIRFSGPPGGALSLTGDIRIFLNLSEADASLMLRLLAHDVIGVYGRAGGSGEYAALSGVGFAVPMTTGEKLFGPAFKANTRGLRILRNFLTYPDFFKFFAVQGLASALGNAAAPADLVIAFKRREQALEANIKTASLKLNCVPVLNLFPKRSNRTVIDRDAYEFHLVPDRTAMGDFEVAAVRNIDFFNERNEQLFSAANFYDESGDRGSKRRFFSLKRRKTLTRSHARGAYAGTEAFVSFSPAGDEASQFAADLLVTNRDLPLLLEGGAEFASSSAMAPRAVFMTLPTGPDYPLVERGGRGDFARLSHIVMNLSALLWQEGEGPLELFRAMLRSYPLRPAEEMDRMINGIMALQSESAAFRFILGGAVFYEWGWKLRFTLDEAAYAGMGWYTFARIAGELFKSLTPVNTFLEIHFTTPQSGTIAIWKTSEIQ
ncbi:MAG: type VI secretion system baseplate subunit TssF [Treponema sp.]|jgi:type VI secretion system VasI/ImpG family protein|nr:type VI secretion system baseplate subunit TssF [Treponema sp.]